jgi:hypothetical protein
MANNDESRRKVVVAAGAMVALIGIAWTVWSRLPAATEPTSKSSIRSMPVYGADVSR